MRKLTALAMAGLAAVVLAGVVPQQSAHAQAAPAAKAPEQVKPLRFDVSAEARKLPPSPAMELSAKRELDRSKAGEKPKREIRNFALPKGEVGRKDAKSRPASLDRALQTGVAPAQLVPAPSLSFDGVSNADNGAAFGFTIFPPDTNGDVGPNHYVQQVNLLVKIFNKAGGLLLGPFKLSQLWVSAGRTDQCASPDAGDPIVLYDPLADRWILSQFAFADSNAPPYYQCIAVSRTPDPTGAYNLYTFLTPGNEFPDYPKLGVWPDAYYMTVNQFTSGGPFNGTGAYAFQRAKMLAGDPTASLVYFNLNLASNPEAIGGMLPSDLDGINPPPAGAPNVFAYFLANEYGDAIDGLRLFNFHVDWANPALSTFTERAESPVAVAAFNPLTPSGRDHIRQPAPATTSASLDSITDRLMFRLQYRNFGTHQSLVTNHSVNVNNSTVLGTFRAGVRYYELRNTAGTYAINEQATFAPTTTPGGGTDTAISRWMGSAAMDASGNLAVGYSASSVNTKPSIWYAARLSTDPPNGLYQGESSLIDGTGVQTNSGSRWGDYSAMSVDPTDDCTFWFTSEYYTAASQALSSIGWLTRIGKFNLGPGTCTPPPKGTGTVNVTNCSSSAPIAGASIYIDGVLYGTTDANGALSATLPPGSHSVTATGAAGFATGTPGTLSVPNGGSGTANLCLAPQPLIALTASAPQVESCTPTNGGVDPGERVTYAVTFSNSGPAPTTSLVATLLANPNLSSPSGPQNYGVIPSGGSATRSFSWTGVGACGTPWTATFALADGANVLPSQSISDAFGALVTTTPLSERFDAVVAPALPAGWVAANAVGVAPLWVTSATTPSSAPNAAFVNDPATVSDKRLDTPTIMIPAAGTTTLSFRNNYNLETTFDGGVLEISISGGAFTDIVTAGGSFVSGGYNATISSCCSSPIAGRRAWSGNAGGYVNTVVNLPAAASGMPVILRFRMGSDDSVAETGWRIDNVVVSKSERVCSNGCAPVRLAASPTLVRNGTNVSATIKVSNSGGATASNVMLTTAMLGTTTCTPTPQSLGNIPAGGSATAAVTCAGVAAGASTMKMGGSYTGGTFSSTLRVSVP